MTNRPLKILVTNDDSHRSPLLEFAVKYFSQIGEVTLVVPRHEQSWTGKSMTRFAPLHVHTEQLFGYSAFSVTGTPADCANIGIYNLCDSPPDLVVSGINAGFNFGVGFVASSGTVGACLEANIAGIPAIALSQMFDPETRTRYIADYSIDPKLIERFNRQAGIVLDKVMEIFLSSANRENFLSSPITWNINFPFELTDPQILRYVKLGRARYGRCVAEEESIKDSGVRVFDKIRIVEVPDPDPNTDSVVVRSGSATVSTVNIWGIAIEPENPLVSRVKSSLTVGAAVSVAE